MRLLQILLARCFLSFCVLSLLGLSVATPANAQGSREGPQGAPKVILSQKVFDFGTVTQGTVVSHEFPLKNGGDGDLVVQRIIPSCGCTAASAAPGPIKPGEEQKIRVSFDTAGFAGEKYKTVRVATNDIHNLSVVLALKGVVEPDVMVNPQSVMLEDLVKGVASPEGSRIVNVSVREGSKVKITGVRAFSPYVSVKELQSSPRSLSFVVSIDPSAPIGEIRDRVVIGINGGKESTINVPVFASIKGQISLQPGQLSFGVIEGAAPITRSVKFTNKGLDLIRVTSVRSTHPAVTASVREIKAGKNYVIHVAVDPSKVTRDLRAAVEVLTDSPQEPNLSLSLFGITVPPKQAS